MKPTQLQVALVTLIDQIGAEAAAAKIGIARETMFRAAAGVRCHRGTITQVATALGIDLDATGGAP